MSPGSARYLAFSGKASRAARVSPCALAMPPSVSPALTVTVKSGDTMGAIASAHGLTLAALLAFPENARYRADPGLIHPGDVVRVK